MTEAETDRRHRILDAALRSFRERGYFATSISDIREASGASTGSIYHFFDNKAAIARALLEGAVASWSRASAAPFGPDVPAERAVKATVEGLVNWGLNNAPLLQFIEEIRTAAGGDPDLALIREALANGRTIGERRYALYISRGEVRPMPYVLAHALVLGPAYDYLRQVGAGQPFEPDAPVVLAAAGWAAVKA